MSLIWLNFGHSLFSPGALLGQWEEEIVQFVLGRNWKHWFQETCHHLTQKGNHRKVWMGKESNQPKMSVKLLVLISYIKPGSAGDGSWRNWCQGGEGEKYGVNFANILQYRFNQTFTHIWQAEITLTQAVLIVCKTQASTALNPCQHIKYP